MSVNYYSQYGEDYWIAAHLNLPEKGYFLDVGAADGIWLSNSYHFEQKNWTGRLCEPDPRWHKALSENRKWPIIDCAVVPESTYDFVPFILSEEAGFSHLGSSSNEPIIRVETITLNEIMVIFQFDEVDILSLDTEGGELALFKSISFRPKVVIIEFKTLDQAPTDLDILCYANSIDYRLVFRTRCNLILIDNQVKGLMKC